MQLSSSSSSSSSSASHVPTSFLDASIPFNLPPRRSMKMLKDGSDFVWPDAAHSLFVKGLQAWKILTIGSKRTRAPRGEGKTDFLVRYLANHGVERTKKQVASHLQVLRTEWRNLDNPILLSLVDEVHTRSLSEPSLPPPAISPDTSANAAPVFDTSPDPTDDQTGSAAHTPPILHTTPPSSTSLFPSLPQQHGPLYSLARSHSVPEVPLRIQSTPDVTSAWQLDPSVWHPPSSAPSTSYYTPQVFPSDFSYQDHTFHSYEGTRLPPFLESSHVDFFSPQQYTSRPTLPPLQATTTPSTYLTQQSQPLFAPSTQQQTYSAPDTVDAFNLGFDSSPFTNYSPAATVGPASFQVPSQLHTDHDPRRQSPPWSSAFPRKQ